MCYFVSEIKNNNKRRIEMRYEILTIIANGKKYYEVTIYNLCDGKLLRKPRFTSKTKMWKFIKEHYNQK